MRSAMVKSLTEVAVDSINNVKQAADAFERVLSEPDEVTEESQVSEKIKTTICLNAYELAFT